MEGIEELRAGIGRKFEPDLLREIEAVGIYREVAAGELLMDIGDFVRGIPLLLSGAIKIMREDGDGDELLLYYLEPGETCSMTLICCMGNARSEIRAIAESDTCMIMIPVGKMEEWTARYRSWRNFVFESYHNRLNELFTTLDSIAFSNMGDRLIHYLKEKARVNKDRHIRNTHQEIAYDLHTSRVVISRLLKKLEKQGKIRLHRNHIEISDL